MTPEQRKRVAEIVTDREWKVVPWRPVNPEYNRDMIMLDGKAGWNQDREWSPDFKGEDWQRSQALAVMEWISDKIVNDVPADEEEMDSLAVLNYIEKKNIESLLRFVLELSDGM